MATEWRWDGGSNSTTLKVNGVTLQKTTEWCMDIEHFALDDGLVSYAPITTSREPFVLVSNTVHDGTWLRVLFRLSGTNNLLMPDGLDIPVTGGEIVILSPVEYSFVYSYPELDKLQAFEFYIRADVLSNLLGDALPSDLLPFMADTPTKSRVIRFQATAEMKAHAAKIMGRERSGSLRKLEHRAFVMSLLALVGAQLDQQKARKSNGIASIHEIDCAMHAYEQIIKSPEINHTSGSLARDCGISERRLSLAFRERFSMSVFQKLKHERMEAARRMLEQDDVLLKEIAHRVGFSQVNNFIRAFSAHYGTAPRTFMQKSEN